MNQQQFNEKLKNYIEKDYQGLCFDIPECTEYLDNKLQEIIKKYPDFKLKQIKVKFNWYCFYSNLPKETENEITKKLLKIHPL
jgi:hypothetical protein